MTITTKLKAKSFPAELNLFIVKLLINVPITSAGIKRLFSSFARTPAELSGTTFSFERIYPKTIKANKNAIWVSVGKKTDMIKPFINNNLFPNINYITFFKKVNSHAQMF